MVDLKEIAENLIQGKADKVKELTQRSVDEGQDVSKILNEGLLAGMSVVGDKFKKNEFYVPEVLIAARAMKAGMEIIRPLLTKKGVKGAGKIILGTVRGDLHDIGKNLVGMMLEGAGFEITDLGVDVSPEKFVEAAREKGADIIGLSALLTTTMPGMKDVIEAIKSSDLKGKLKVMIGGAPVTQDYADEIGADGYAPDAASAVDKAKQLIGA
ncbi:cobalamin-binding protein [Candidatus Aerophobetes bacterium]|uniref:Cobalamin-binding protein n=1 Tax=Aerophobetes bacterium TaxID=2030807 RepID=A0A662DGJ3_UNCAE|nr:MAG: cobalamin-binding protein [Candidatus Aerophobetes bacterium]